MPPPPALNCAPSVAFGPFCEQPSCGLPCATLQSVVAERLPSTHEPEKSASPTLASLQFDVVWMLEKTWLWRSKPSTMSHSPHIGHASPVPVIQNAGHTPQPVGMCARLSTKSPDENVAVDSMRTESRLVAFAPRCASSTPMYTDDAVALMSPRAAAVSRDV